MVADLYGGLFVPFRYFIKNVAAKSSSFSPRNNDKTTRNNETNMALISAAKYFAPLFIVLSIYGLFAKI